MLKQLSGSITYEFQYETESERLAHIHTMESAGFTVSGPIRRSTDPFFGKTPRVFHPYAKFEKTVPLHETAEQEVPHV